MWLTNCSSIDFTISFLQSNRKPNPTYLRKNLKKWSVREIMNTNPSILVSRLTFFYSPLFFSVQFMEESFLITLGLSVFTLKRETALIQNSRRLLLWMSLDSSSTTCEQCNKVCTIRSRTFRRLFHLVCQFFCSYFYFSNDPLIRLFLIFYYYYYR